MGRGANLRLQNPNLSCKTSASQFVLMVFEILSKNKIFKLANQDNHKSFLQIWQLILNNKILKEKFPSALHAIEIMLVENPSNSNAEALGRITNMIRSSLRIRMSESLVDCEVTIYKNTP